MPKLVMQIYEGETPLRQLDCYRIISQITDDQIRETANLILTDNKNVPRRCNNKHNDLYKKCVGGGVCLAKKYKRLGITPDQTCSSCQTDVITNTLNYIFDQYYEGRYKAVWRTTRSKKALRTKQTRKKKTKQDMVNQINNMDKVPSKEVGPPRRGQKN